MSENIRGITFAEQAVTPADDAIVRRAMLGDGVLTGCEVTYSGSTLTLAPGYIIACGRSFQITSAQNFAVVDATSGVARLLLTIDMTKTATENAFSQIDFAVEYASAEDGFADLVQEDINISGTRYQIVAAVVSLGTGGITGIVDEVDKTESGGLSMKLLWKNRDPSSDFPSQLVSLDLANFDLVCVTFYANRYGQYVNGCSFFKPGEMFDLRVPLAASVNARRENTSDVNGIFFKGGMTYQSGNSTGTDSDQAIIPNEIYGLKGVTA